MAAEAERRTELSQGDNPQADGYPALQDLQRLLDTKRASFSRHVDEVWPNLFLGDLVTANNRYELWKLGITHVLNAAHGRRFSEGNADFHGASVTYHGVAANDVPDFDMSQYFYSASEFIHQALSITGGRLLVHCVVGISRSATLVLAYLMIHQHLSLTQAVRRVLEKRWVSPNAGFLRQLLRLEEQLRQARGQQGQGATEQSPAAGEDITLQ